MGGLRADWSRDDLTTRSSELRHAAIGIPGDLRVAPVPGHGVNAATATLRTPYGPAACDWTLDGHQITLAVDIPPNTSATVVRPGLPDPVDVGSGHHEWIYDVTAEVVTAWRDESWNPGP